MGQCNVVRDESTYVYSRGVYTLDIVFLNYSNQLEAKLVLF